MQKEMSKEKIRERLQKQWREKHGVSVRGLLERYRVNVDEVLQGLKNNKEKQSRNWIFNLYPGFMKWWTKKKEEKWTPMDITVRPSDYGTSSWGIRTKRRIETVFVELNVKLKNSLLGEYQNTCFILGIIRDKEFDNILREPFESFASNKSCRDVKLDSDWKVKNEFQSQWRIPVK
ncbi:MAG: hypothetical protein ACJZ47_04030 [bacterium]